MSLMPDFDHVPVPHHPPSEFLSHDAEARTALAEWIKQGRLRYREDILDGIEQAPDAIAGLYRGDNLGKRLIRIAGDDAV